MFNLKHVDDVLVRDKEFVLELVKLDKHLFLIVSEELRNDKGFVLEAVKHHWRALELVNIRFKNDPDVVHAALQSSPFAMIFVGDQFRQDVVFYLKSQKGVMEIYQDVFKERAISSSVYNQDDGTVEKSGHSFKYVWLTKGRYEPLYLDIYYIVRFIVDDGFTKVFSRDEIHQEEQVSCS